MNTYILLNQNIFLFFIIGKSIIRNTKYNNNNSIKNRELKKQKNNNKKKII